MAVSGKLDLATAGYQIVGHVIGTDPVLRLVEVSPYEYR